MPAAAHSLLPHIPLALTPERGKSRRLECTQDLCCRLLVCETVETVSVDQRKGGLVQDVKLGSCHPRHSLQKEKCKAHTIGSI